MQPLVKNSQQSTKKKYWCPSLCIIAAIICTVLITCIAYLGTASNIDSQSPAKNLSKKQSKKQDTSDLTPSEISLPTTTMDEPFYPREVIVDSNREIIKSDTTKTSSYYKSEGKDDIIESMPYLIKSTCSSSPSNCGFEQYSGYLLANKNREIHYWFIQAETKPQSKPVFFWTNGGPGCSGMDGLLTEHGPWKVLENAKIAYNPYSWNTEVNMVYLEQPYGVGFSTVNTGDSVVGGDQNAADDMDAAIRDFINKFPSFANNKIYLSSESWGGHYVPITSYTILQNNDAGVTPYINFGGFLLGNPSTDHYENIYGFVGGIYGHGLMKSTDWYTWRNKCWGNAKAIDRSETCSAIHTRAYYSAFNANVYALDYPQCKEDESWTEPVTSILNEDRINTVGFMKDAHLHHAARKSMQKVLNSQNYGALKMGHIKKDDLQQLHDKIDARLNKKTVLKKQASVLKAADMNGIQTKSDTLDNDETDSLDTDSYEPCIDYYMATYLNMEEVQTALNVKSTAWEMCSDDVWYAWPESDFRRHIEPYYTQIIDQYVDELGLTLCVYSGDDDSVCGVQGTMYWLDRIGYDADDKIAWKAWNDDEQQLSGYYTKYLGKHGNVGLHFLTVRSAGHMVPETQPERALTVLKKYLYKFKVHKE